VADGNCENFVPYWIEAVLEPGRLQKLNLVKKDSDKRVGPVASADVEESVVGVREVPRSDHVNLEVAVLQQDGCCTTRGDVEDSPES